MYERILVPYDGSETSIRGLDEAVELARLTGATLSVLHIVEILHFITGFEPATVYANDAIPLMMKAGEALLEKARARVTEHGVPVHTVLLQSMAVRVCEMVIDQARSWDARLIVIGTHGRRGFGRFLLGSDAEQIVRLSHCPVLLVRQAQTAAGAAARTR